MPDNKSKEHSTHGSSGPIHLRIVKVGLERLASAGGKFAASDPHIQAAIDAFKAPIDKIIGTGSADAFFGSEAIKILMASGIQLPGTFLRPVLARMLRIDESLANEIVQEGVDKAILSFLDETGRAARDKNPAEQKAIIDKNASDMVDKVQAMLRLNNSEGIKPVWFDPESKLAHKPGCAMFKNDKGKPNDCIIYKDDAGNDLTLLAAKKLGGHMTCECRCVGNFSDPPGTLDEALMRLDHDERRALDAYIASMLDIRSEFLKKGSSAKDVNAAKLRLVLKTADPAMKRERLLLLVRMDGVKSAKSPLEMISDTASRGIETLNSGHKRAAFREETRRSASSLDRTRSRIRKV